MKKNDVKIDIYPKNKDFSLKSIEEKYKIIKQEIFGKNFKSKKNIKNKKKAINNSLNFDLNQTQETFDRYDCYIFLLKLSLLAVLLIVFSFVFKHIRDNQ